MKWEHMTSDSKIMKVASWGVSHTLVTLKFMVTYGCTRGI